MSETSYTTEVRRVETDFAETGDPAKGTPGQYAPRTDVTYELGATVDGAWIKFASVQGSTVEALVARAKDSAPPADEGPTMADVAPTPAPQATAAQGSV